MKANDPGITVIKKYKEFRKMKLAIAGKNPPIVPFAVTTHTHFYAC